jgi:PIN domain nuclease of toxin-antitoxin system
MRLLLDTHVVIALSRNELVRRFPEIVEALAEPSVDACVSVASLWEIAIKTRLGKLDAQVPLDRLPDVLENFALEILDINSRHALGHVAPEPRTRDPFDRMLLAQCRIEGLQLVTLDRALAEHPLAWRRGRA